MIGKSGGLGTYPLIHNVSKCSNVILKCCDISVSDHFKMLCMKSLTQSWNENDKHFIISAAVNL